MISLRKWLYKPRRDDKSLFAKFWYADDNLNRVAAELDSFDGRKDPERCAALVSKLRSCQDKLLNICNKMLDELEGPDGRANREFRVKFPDEIVTENLGGQLWFGAECLAAGSSIMQKEFESAQMRPLAKAVTKTLEKVRGLIREQCLSAASQYTEQIHETLKIFDRMFAEFEFSYVSCMVHVKTIDEYEIHQDVICLFSETLHRSIKNNLISQDMVDYYDPSLMFAIPRLAIVTGLLIFPAGPLNVDREYSDFPELFRPFKNLLRKIRELLWTLTPAEFYVLERLLCQLEEPDDLQRKLQAAQIELEEKQRIAENIEKQENQAALLDAKLTSLSNIPCVCDTQQPSNTSTKQLNNCDTTTTTTLKTPTKAVGEVSASMPASYSSPSHLTTASITDEAVTSSPIAIAAVTACDNNTADGVVEDIINQLLAGVVGLHVNDNTEVESINSSAIECSNSSVIEGSNTSVIEDGNTSVVECSDTSAVDSTNTSVNSKSTSVADSSSIRRSSSEVNTEISSDSSRHHRRRSTENSSSSYSSSRRRKSYDRDERRQRRSSQQRSSQQHSTQQCSSQQCSTQHGQTPEGHCLLADQGRGEEERMRSNTRLERGEEEPIRNNNREAEEPVVRSSTRRRRSDDVAGKERKSDNNTPTKKTVVEIDCSGPDITVSPVQVQSHHHNHTTSTPNYPTSTPHTQETKSRSRSVNSTVAPPSSGQDGFRAVERARKGLKRRGAKRSHKSWKEARARFKSSEDLVHRLYVCISGAADQLQTNFAGDFRHILKYVFVMNATQDEEEEEETEEETTEEAEDLPSENEEADLINDQQIPQDNINTEEEQQEEDGAILAAAPEPVSATEPVSAATAINNTSGVNEQQQAAAPISFSTPARNSTGYECGEDALMNESEQSYLRSFSGSTAAGGGPMAAAALLSTSPPSMLANMPVYASNLDQHIDRALLTEGHGSGESEQYYQPETTLLTVASGANTSASTTPTEEQEEVRRRGVEAPPPWIPDHMAPLCMGCGQSFSMVRRRHHCRSCGRVFCGKCSPNQVPLPRYGMDKPVRVCNRCYIYYMNPYEERTVHAYHVYNGTGHGSWGYTTSLVS